jgi:ketosteroid isomerase-like protein
MSRQPLEVVEELYAGYAAGGFPAHLFAPDVVWHGQPHEPEPGPFNGAAEIGAMLARYWEVATDPWMEVLDYIEAGDWVIVPWRGGGKGAGSGLSITYEETHACRVRDGLVVEVREFADPESALAGLATG